jgi:hypothetical protein
MIIVALVTVILFTCSTSTRAAEPWTRDDSVTAVIAAADRHTLSRAELLCITWYESAGWNPRARGDSGQARGLAQLRADGIGARFAGDPDNPFEAAEFLAQQLAAGAGPQHWARSWRLCNG